MLRLGSISGSCGQVLVKYAGQSYLYYFRSGLQAGLLPVRGSGNPVEIDKVTGNLPCFGNVEVGYLLPCSTGPTYPAMAVSG